MTLKMFLVLTSWFLFFNEWVQGSSELFSRARNNHNAFTLNYQEVSQVARMTDTYHLNRIFDEILAPRVVGTSGHDRVANYIVDTMYNLGWDIERDWFRDTTSWFGEVQFQNIIAKLNPNADRFLVLACHYDSRYIKGLRFVGATDSAVPCAMMLNLAYVLRKQLNAAKLNNEISLQFVFFDGEENLGSDDLYGSRHLASKWDKQIFRTTGADIATDLDRIDVLVLLNLLGAPDPKFPNNFADTGRWFNRLGAIEQRLDDMGYLRNYRDRYFVRSLRANIKDDHVPFKQRGVPVLQIVSVPFPAVWHKYSDDRSAVDMHTVENLNMIFRVFVSEYLKLHI